MKQIIGTRALIASIVGLVAMSVGSASALAAGPVTKTFSFIARPNSRTVTIVNIDGLLINARCNARGEPVIFAFSSATSADLFGHVFDGLGRLHVVHNSSFTRTSKGVLLSPTTSDFDASGTLLYEASNGKVVTVAYAFDNSTTLANQNLCTVYGSFVAT
jgi:hypothetical protein